MAEYDPYPLSGEINSEVADPARPSRRSPRRTPAGTASPSTGSTG